VIEWGEEKARRKGIKMVDANTYISSVLSVSDNIVLKMQTSNCEKFFNYFRITLELFKELLAL